MTFPPSLTKRTTSREIPRGRAARIGSGHSSSGTCHGRSSSAGSGWAAVIWRLRLTGVLGPGVVAPTILADDDGALARAWAASPARGERRAGRAGVPARPAVRAVGDSDIEALTRGSVELVLLALADADPDGLALRGDAARVDAHDEDRKSTRLN